MTRCICGGIATEYDQGDGAKFLGCYKCQEPTYRCDCKRQKVFKIVLRYKGEDYVCEAYCSFDEACGGWWSAYEDGSVRNCEHDYAMLLPEHLRDAEDWGCSEGKLIEVVGYWFEDNL